MSSLQHIIELRHSLAFLHVDVWLLLRSCSMAQRHIRGGLILTLHQGGQKTSKSQNCQNCNQIASFFFQKHSHFNLNILFCLCWFLLPAVLGCKFFLIWPQHILEKIKNKNQAKEFNPDLLCFSPGTAVALRHRKTSFFSDVPLLSN